MLLFLQIIAIIFLLLSGVNALNDTNKGSHYSSAFVYAATLAFLTITTLLQ